MPPSEETGGDGVAADPTPSPSEHDQLERLRAENEALKQQLDHERAPRRGRLRAVAVGVIIAIAALTFTASEVGVWVRRSVLNEEVFVSRVAPLASDPAVQTAVAAKAVDEIMTLVDPQALFQDALPDRAQILAPVLTNAVRSFVSDQVHAFVASDTFAQLWARIVRRAHETAINVLNGDSQVVTTSGSKLVISLVPAINAILARIGEVSPQIFGKTIDIPTLTATDLAGVVPDQAREALARALGRPVPETFGTIEIAGAGDTLRAAQDGVRLANLLFWGLVVITVILIPLALWLSRRRRRTLLQLVALLVLGTVVVRRVLITTQSVALNQVQVPDNRPAVDSVLRAFLDPLHDATTVLLWVLGLIALVAVVTAPYPWMVKVRTTVLGLLRRGTTTLGTVADRAVDPAAAAWVRAHRGLLQGAGVAVAALLLLVLDLSLLGMLVLLVVLGAYLAAVWWVTEETGAPSASTPPTDAVSPPPSAPAPF